MCIEEKDTKMVIVFLQFTKWVTEKNCPNETAQNYLPLRSVCNKPVAMEDAPSHQPAQDNYTKHEPEENNGQAGAIEQLSTATQNTLLPENGQAHEPQVRMLSVGPIRSHT
jgi:hypothetical protein